MENRNNLLLKSISMATTFGLLYVMVSLFIYDDFLNSLIPGWHKSLYRLNGALRTTIIAGVSAVVGYFLFMLVYRLLVYLQSKIGK
jgi:uncharacterized membrane protein (GlpM family)